MAAALQQRRRFFDFSNATVNCRQYKKPYDTIMKGFWLNELFLTRSTKHVGIEIE